jgi:SulP family sulfate permease
MKSTGFYKYLGEDHFLEQDNAITFLFHRVLDPAVCIYECETRTFKECQNLPRPSFPVELPFTAIHSVDIPQIPPENLWAQIQMSTAPFILDVREPREYNRGHIPSAESIPLLKLMTNDQQLPHNRQIVLVCLSGRRSVRAASILQSQGFHNLGMLAGGMLGWENTGLLEAVERPDS